MTASTPLRRYRCDHHQCSAEAYVPVNGTDPTRPVHWLNIEIGGRFGLERIHHLCPVHADELESLLTGIDRPLADRDQDIQP